MAIDYSEAVQTAKATIQNALSEKFATIASGESHLSTMGASMLRRETARMLEWAETDARGFDALRLGAAYALEKDEPLPPKVRTWLVRYLRGKVTRPKAWPGAKGGSWLHFIIWDTVGYFVRNGMKATRNDASEPTSACDAVADALLELGLKPTTFHGVKRIWLQYESGMRAMLDGI